MALTKSQLAELRRQPVEPGGNRVQIARRLAGHTQVELAQALGMPQSSLSDLERSRYSETTVTTASRIAAHFGCLIEDLFPVKEAVAS